MYVDGKVLLVVAGGEGHHGPETDFNVLDSVELLDPSSLEQGWKFGKILKKISL